MNKLEYTKQTLINNFNNNLIPFWDKMIDDEYGGFYGMWNKDPIKNADKGIIYLSRLLWSFSVAYQYTNNIIYLSYSNYIFKFMINKLYDYEHKGFYYNCDYKGNVKNNHKHLYAQSFSLYGLSEYYLITNSEECLKIINDLHSIIKCNIINFPKNYCEEYTIDWVRTDNKILEGYGMIPEITTNTLLHLIESLGTAYRVLRNGEIKDTCLKYLDILFKYGFDYDRKTLIQFLDYDLQSKIDVISYGHDIEVSWLLIEVLKQIECNEVKYSNWYNFLIELGKSSLKGFKNNYLLAEKIKGRIKNKDIIWWVQAECLIGLLNLYNYTDDEKYLDMMYNLINVVKDAIMTEDEWLWSADEHFNSKEEHPQAEMWKANYHNFRCIFKFMEV